MQSGVAVIYPKGEKCSIATYTSYERVRIGMYIIRSDEEILTLIRCEKKIQKKPPNLKKSNRDIKTRFRVISTEESLEFEVFFAQNARLHDDFSLGLMLDKYLLYRCNGFHGTTFAGYHVYEHHAQIHSHTLTFEDIINGRSDKPSKIDCLTNEYFNFISAQLYFLRLCGINNYQDYFDFSKLNQISIYDL